MKQIYHFSDQLSGADYIPCSEGHGNERFSGDHIPTKALLNPPYPENLMKVGTCQECNSGFAEDEEYFAAFLASVVSGSTEPDPEQFPTAAGSLAHSAWLRNRIDRARRVQGTEIRWIPERERIEKVIVKKARGHVLYELGETLDGSPSYVKVTPLQSMTAEQRLRFERPSGLAGWPEVGSRLMQRLLETGECGPGGWIESAARRVPLRH